MNDALRVAGFAAAAALMAMVLRAARGEAGRAVALGGGLMLFFFAMTQLRSAVEALEGLSQRAGLNQESLALLLKLVAIAYITEFAVQVCRDAGEEGLGAKAGLCGKLLLMGQTLPLILEIGEIALDLVP